MNILIIGGSRFIGPYIIDELLKKNHAITIFNRGLIKLKYKKGVTFIKGDRNEGFKIKDHFNIVIDTCAYNGWQTETVLKQLNFDFLIHISSAAVYKKTELFPLIEDSSVLGDWPLWGDYNRGKVECETILKKSKIKFASIRPVYILGPNNHVDREHFIYSRIKKGEHLTLPGNGEAVVQFVFAQEVAKTVSFLAENKIIGAFNCCSNELITLKGLVEEMARIVGVKARLQFNLQNDGDKFNVGEFPFANENFFCSNAKLKKLGIEFTPLLPGLKDDYQNHYKNLI